MQNHAENEGMISTAKIAAQAVIAPVKYAFDPLLASMGLAIGTSATIASHALGKWLIPGYFLGALLLMSTLEILTCYFGNPKEARRAFSWERVIVGKLLLISLVVVALLLDGMLYFGSTFIPGEWDVIGSGILPITISSLTWFNMAEAARTVRNVARSEGEGAIPPAVLWIIRQLRKVDEKRFAEGAPEEATHPPASRWTDDLTVEQIEALLAQRRAQDGTGAFPSPIDPPSSDGGVG